MKTVNRGVKILILNKEVEEIMKSLKEDIKTSLKEQYNLENDVIEEVLVVNHFIERFHHNAQQFEHLETEEVAMFFFKTYKHLKEKEKEKEKEEHDVKMLEYAMDLKEDLTCSLENGEEQDIKEKDIQVFSWLVEQAKRAKMYKDTLIDIGTRNETPNSLPASLVANLTLNDADLRFKPKNK